MAHYFIVSSAHVSNIASRVKTWKKKKIIQHLHLSHLLRRSATTSAAATLTWNKNRTRSTEERITPKEIISISMQKLLYCVKTLSSPSLNLFLKLSSSSSPHFLPSLPVPSFRSYKSASITGGFIKIPMASSATMKLPASPIEEGMGRRFWINSKKEWTQALYTPFVVCLAAGNLKLDTFRSYIAQDVHFLRAFAKAWVILVDVFDCSASILFIRLSCRLLIRTVWIFLYWYRVIMLVEDFVVFGMLFLVLFQLLENVGKSIEVVPCCWFFKTQYG